MQRKEQTIKVTNGPEVSGKPSSSRQDLGLSLHPHPSLIFFVLATRRYEGWGESVDHFGVPENALRSVQRKLGFALSLSPTHFYTHSTRQRLEAWAERAEKKQEVEMEYKKEEKLILLLFRAEKAKEENC